jgi:RNA polymerase sigma-70 factor (ECF subfamily)
MNYKRKKKNDRLIFLDDLKQIDNLSWLIEQSDSSQSEILYRCIDELNDINKAIILLYLDGNSHDEIEQLEKE